MRLLGDPDLVNDFVAETSSDALNEPEIISLSDGVFARVRLWVSLPMLRVLVRVRLGRDRLFVADGSSLSESDSVTESVGVRVRVPVSFVSERVS